MYVYFLLFYYLFIFGFPYFLIINFLIGGKCVLVSAAQQWNQS